MTESDLKKLTLTTAARLIRRRELSSVEMTETVLGRIARLNDRMRAFITVTADRAMDEARKADRDLLEGRTIGPLQGVPVSLKDLYDTKGVPTTAGSKVYANRIPNDDGTVVQKLKEAGAIVVGKANLHEFAYGVTTINPHYGTARNPWNPDYISGGSSGGSASAVALSMGFGSLGSDTGGSIRIPASICGIVGLKPTYGRCSLHGVVPLSWSMDHPGPMGQTVEDVALLLGVIAGYDPADPCSQNKPVPSYVDALTGNVQGLRIGVPRPYFFDGLAAEVDAAVSAALKTFERLGANVVEIDLPSAPLQRGIWSQIASPEAFSYHEKLLEAHGTEYGADVRNRIETGRLLLSIDYVRAQRARTLMKKESQKVFQSVDVIVVPSLPVTPPRIDQGTVQRGSVTEPTGVALTRCTRHFNVTGLPAVSIPCGFASNGLPLGMQIAGRAFDEATVLRAAHAYEQDARWFERRCEM
jgi:aspartyl-tRNA(Asn)/glutamyl-tRNA(Gln) amidotransferase subunit A